MVTAPHCPVGLFMHQKIFHRFRFAPKRVPVRWHWSPLLTIATVLIVWQAVVSGQIVPEFLVPSPLRVGEKFLEVLADGTWIGHTTTTLTEMTFGLLAGVSLGVLLGIVIAKNPALEKALSPLIVAFQATPVVAYAPLLIIWFGSGITSKIVTCAIVVFFPMLLNTVAGIRSVPQGLRDLFRSLRATPWQTFTRLEVPAALPILLTGLKTSATLALIGAVVGEFVSARQGLGVLVTLARSQYDTPLLFVGILTMTALALLFYGSISLLEYRLLRWQRAAHPPI